MLLSVKINDNRMKIRNEKFIEYFWLFGIVKLFFNASTIILCSLPTMKTILFFKQKDSLKAVKMEIFNYWFPSYINCIKD